MDHRIEIMYPIFDPSIKDRIIDEILATYWQDTVKAKQLTSAGTYIPRTLDPQQPPWRAQLRLSAKYRRLNARHLNHNKIVVALARELSGFVWAIGQSVKPQ